MFDLTWLTESGGCAHMLTTMHVPYPSNSPQLYIIMIFSPLEQFCFCSASTKFMTKECFAWDLDRWVHMMSETFGANSMLDVAMCPVDTCPPNLGLFNSVERPQSCLSRSTKGLLQWLQLQSIEITLHGNTHEFQNTSTCPVHAKIFESLRAWKPSVERHKCSHPS